MKVTDGDIPVGDTRAIEKEGDATDSTRRIADAELSADGPTELAPRGPGNRVSVAQSGVKGSRSKRSLTRMKKVCRWIADGYSISRAARECGLGERTIYEWREKDPEFEAMVGAAQEVATQKLEDELRDRVMDGDEVPHTYQGMVVETTRKKSEKLLMFQLAAKRPDVYRDSSKLEVTHGITHDFAERLRAAHAAPAAPAGGGRTIDHESAA